MGMLKFLMPIILCSKDKLDGNDKPMGIQTFSDRSALFILNGPPIDSEKEEKEFTKETKTKINELQEDLMKNLVEKFNMKVKSEEVPTEPFVSLAIKFREEIVEKRKIHHAANPLDQKLLLELSLSGKSFDDEFEATYAKIFSEIVQKMKETKQSEESDKSNQMENLKAASEQHKEVLKGTMLEVVFFESKDREEPSSE